MPKETSDDVATLASEYMDFHPEDLIDIISEGYELETLCRDIRTLAASCIAQADGEE